MRQTKGQTREELLREWYLQEKKVAEALAKHVAELLLAVNHIESDWHNIYTSTHRRVSMPETEIIQNPEVVDLPDKDIPQ